jgi:CBS domain containing-hemolysin-like protein
MVETSWMAVVLLAALDLVVVSVRASFVNLRLHELNKRREQNHAAIDRVTALAEKPRFRASLRLLTAGMHFLTAGAVLALVQAYHNGPLTLGQALGIVLLAGGLLLLVEFTLEGRVLRRPETLALRLAPLASLLDFILTPVTYLLVVLWRRPSLPPGIAIPVTEDALRTWVEAGRVDGGSLEPGERKMIYSIFQFGDTLAREVMVPRIDLTAFEVNMPLAEAIKALIKTGHSRVPVYEGTIDNIVGLLYAKDLLLVKDQPASLTALRERLRPAYFIPETKKVDEVLTEMQERRIHVAIVVDEYGGVAGMVTLENIVEEIVGEIRDEYDQGEEQLYQQVGPDEYLFQGKIGLDDFNEVMGTYLEKDEANTLAGFIYGQMGRVPAGGEQVVLDDLILTVEQVSGRRIRKVRAQRIPSTQEKEIEGSNAD